MIDLDELIAEARRRLASDPLVMQIVDALVSVRAERDAALARIAELEKMLENYTREYPIECNKRVKAEARIAEAAKLHRNAGPSQGYDSRFRGGYGMLGDCCASCGSHGEYGVEWPCPTAVALGLNEGDER